MLIAAVPETPSIAELTEAVVVDVIAVLEYTAEDRVTVTSFPLFEATTEAPTKLKDEAAVVMLDPSSLTTMSVPAPPIEELKSEIFSSRPML